MIEKTLLSFVFTLAVLSLALPSCSTEKSVHKNGSPPIDSARIALALVYGRDPDRDIHYILRKCSTDVEKCISPVEENVDVFMELEIEDDGFPATLRVKRSNLDDASTGCIIEKLQRLRYRSNGRPQKIEIEIRSRTRAG